MRQFFTLLFHHHIYLRDSVVCMQELYQPYFQHLTCFNFTFCPVIVAKKGSKDNGTGEPEEILPSSSSSGKCLIES